MSETKNWFESRDPIAEARVTLHTQKNKNIIRYIFTSITTSTNFIKITLKVCQKFLLQSTGIRISKERGGKIRSLFVTNLSLRWMPSILLKNYHLSFYLDPRTRELLEVPHYWVTYAQWKPNDAEQEALKVLRCNSSRIGYFQQLLLCFRLMHTPEEFLHNNAGGAAFP